MNQVANPLVVVSLSVLSVSLCRSPTELLAPPCMEEACPSVGSDVLRGLAVWMP